MTADTMVAYKKGSRKY